MKSWKEIKRKWKYFFLTLKRTRYDMWLNWFYRGTFASEVDMDPFFFFWILLLLLLLLLCHFTFLLCCKIGEFLCNSHRIRTENVLKLIPTQKYFSLLIIKIYLEIFRWIFTHHSSTMFPLLSIECFFLWYITFHFFLLFFLILLLLLNI